MQVDGVEPTNNAAARASRPGVQRRKLNCGTHSEAGSHFVERIMTVVATLHHQQRNVWNTSQRLMKPLSGVNTPLLCCLPGTSSRKLWHNFCFHNLNAYTAFSLLCQPSPN
ncbi:MAG: hypothetical protein AB7N91_28960 [Candidatus Tectimicrobiota bacterium]